MLEGLQKHAELNHDAQPLSRGLAELWKRADIVKMPNTDVGGVEGVHQLESRCPATKHEGWRSYGSMAT